MAPWRASAAIALALVTIASASVRGADEATQQCKRAAPRRFSLDQAKRLCSRAAEGLGDGPAACASTVVSSGVTSLSWSADLASDIISLCDSAVDATPADCWSAVQYQTLRAAEWRQATVQVCKQATDTRPALCLEEFKRQGLTGSPAKRETAMAVVTGICRGFRGDAPAIGMCLKLASRSLPESSRFALCRDGNAVSVPDVVECAKQLLQRNVHADTVAHLCSSAGAGRDEPQQCVLAAHQQLRWMDSGVAARLCQHSIASTAPVECATAQRSWFTEQFGKSASLADLAELCHRAIDAARVAQCVKKLPSNLFTPAQVVRLCGSQGVEAEVAAFKINCVEKAGRQLFGSIQQYRFDDKSSVRADHASLLMALCADARSSGALGCLTASASRSPPLCAHDSVRLCAAAVSAVPYECLHSIQPSILTRLPQGVTDAIELCRQSESLEPALCVNQLHDASAAFFSSGFATALCKHAESTAPATCFFVTPSRFSDQAKVVLCAQATSEQPAVCARESPPRFHEEIRKAQLCARAASTAPARCASSSPFGMSVDDVVHLCRRAVDEKPAQCARQTPPHLRIPWRTIAAVCHGATSSTPGSCLVHAVRQRIWLSQRVILDCRSTVSAPSSIEIVHFGYECPELMPKCAITVTTRILDQYGDEIPSLTAGYVHFSVTPDDETATNGPAVRGATTSAIVNGSATFHAIRFTAAGNFTLRLASPGVDEMIARLHVRANETEQRQLDQCQRSMSYMQCEHRGAAVSGPHVASNATLAAQQILLLPNRHVVGAMQCESLWVEQHGGLRPLGSVAQGRIYALPRMAYQLLNGENVPTAAMSCWERLGIPEGSNRSIVRRAYHQRSLEWHPDKWLLHSADAPTGPSSALRGRVEDAYALINDAYQQLLQRDDTTAAIHP